MHDKHQYFLVQSMFWSFVKCPRRIRVEYVLSIPLTCRKKWLIWGKPSDKIRKIYFSLPNRYDTIETTPLSYTVRAVYLLPFTGSLVTITRFFLFFRQAVFNSVRICSASHPNDIMLRIWINKHLGPLQGSSKWGHCFVTKPCFSLIQ